MTDITALIAELRAEHATHYDKVGDLLFDAARALEAQQARITEALTALAPGVRADPDRIIRILSAPAVPTETKENDRD